MLTDSVVLFCFSSQNQRMCALIFHRVLLFVSTLIYSVCLIVERNSFCNFYSSLTTNIETSKVCLTYGFDLAWSRGRIKGFSLKHFVDSLRFLMLTTLLHWLGRPQKSRVEMIWSCRFFVVLVCRANESLSVFSFIHMKTLIFLPCLSFYLRGFNEDFLSKSFVWASFTNIYA